jgi:hypothetical protein
VTSTVSSLFTDGSLVTGRGTDNRTIKLRVMIGASAETDVRAAAEALFAEANKPNNTVTFTRSDAPTVVYDVFRATKLERTDSFGEGLGLRTYEISLPALPYPRSGEKEHQDAESDAAVIENFEDAIGDGYTQAAFTQVAVNYGKDGFRWPIPEDHETLGQEIYSSQLRLTAVRNATVSDQGSTQRLTRKSAQGFAEARTTDSWDVSGDLVVVGWVTYVNASVTVGAEWLDSNGSSIRTDWGMSIPEDSHEGNVTPWVVLDVPAAAASIRPHFRWPAAAAEWARVMAVGAYSTSTKVSLHRDQVAHEGDYSLEVQCVGDDPSVGSYDYGENAGFAQLPLNASVDVSKDVTITAWIRFATNQDSATPCGQLELHDRDSGWTVLPIPSTAYPPDSWKKLTWTIDKGSITSVDAIRVSVICYGLLWFYLDDLRAMPPPDADNATEYSSLFQLAARGSARAPVTASLSATSALHDWLVYASDDAAPVQLAVDSNDHASVDPHPLSDDDSYQGEYTLLAPITNGARGNRSIKVEQLDLNGNTVADKTLSSTVMTGVHYYEYPPILLPIVAVDDNSSVGYRFTFTGQHVAHGGGWILVLNVNGALAFQPDQDPIAKRVWIDPPTAGVGVGHIYTGNQADRSDARAPSKAPILSRPLAARSPVLSLLVFSTTIAPSIALSYYPRWLVEPSD